MYNITYTSFSKYNLTGKPDESQGRKAIGAKVWSFPDDASRLQIVLVTDFFSFLYNIKRPVFNAGCR